MESMSYSHSKEIDFDLFLRVLDKWINMFKFLKICKFFLLDDKPKW